jgi:hypothetical protein
MLLGQPVAGYLIKSASTVPLKQWWQSQRGSPPNAPGLQVVQYGLGFVFSSQIGVPEGEGEGEGVGLGVGVVPPQGKKV